MSPLVIQLLLLNHVKTESVEKELLRDSTVALVETMLFAKQIILASARMIILKMYLSNVY